MASEKRPPETLKALAEESFARWRERPAFTSMGVTLSWGSRWASASRSSCPTCCKVLHRSLEASV
jgi:hypothetical protein